MRWYDELLTVTAVRMACRWLRGAWDGRGDRHANAPGPSAGGAGSVLGMLERAAEANPESAEVQAGLGRALLDAGRHSEALGAIERAISLDGARPELHAQRARALRLLGRHAEASDALDRVAELALPQKAPA